MSVKENLIAVKSLIDTPEKMFAFQDNAAAFQYAMDAAIEPFDEDSYRDVVIFLRNANGSPGLLEYLRRSSHADIMGLFERSIKAAS